MQAVKGSQSKRSPACAVVFVTHNSERFISHAMEGLRTQTKVPEQIIIVDSASTDSSYLSPFANQPNVHIEYIKTNIGFCRGNNLGRSLVPEDCPYILFLNPDAFLSPTFIAEAIAFMESKDHKRCGVMTGILLGYDITRNKPTGTYDSTGIFSTWYGKWFDRDQGLPCDPKKYQRIESVPAICGALMFCRKNALDSVQMGKYEVFDSAFYMYKEDIDLSYRLKKAGWQLMLVPQLIAYHCRGWQRNRSMVPRKLRLLSAKNELRMHVRQNAPIKMLYSLLKLTFVFCFNI